ncbi:hypothetical protein SCLCIDRAFT_1151828, partial [Scleroderma citrinum Foug A]
MCTNDSYLLLQHIHSPTIDLKLKRFKISLLTSETHLLALSCHSTSMSHYHV